MWVRMNPHSNSAEQIINHNRQRGFSVLEILGVLVIVGILTALAIAPMDRYIKSLRQKSVLGEIKHMLISARSRALANPGVHCGAYFDLSTNPQKIVLFNDNFAPANYSYDANRDKAYLTSYPIPQGFTVKIDSGYKPEIIFRGDGSAFLSGKILISSSAFTDTLDILASTGRIWASR
jgi:prepilin-type N-terminal cleavage/methylation domain-containing protein